MTTCHSPLFKTVIVVVLTALFGLEVQIEVRAGDAARFFPATTIVYAEVDQPAGLIDKAQQNPQISHLVGELKSIPAARKAIEGKDFQKFQFALKVVEAKLGQKWPEALSSLTHHGISFGVDPVSDGVAILMQAKETESLDKITSSLLEMVEQDAKSKGNDPPFERLDYREAKVFKADNFGFATWKNWLLIANKSDVGRSILDALIDDSQKGLASAENFQNASKSRTENAIAWVYVDIDAARAAKPEEKIYSNRADDPGGEFLLGGLYSAFHETPYLTGELLPIDNGLKLRFSVPFDRSSISEERVHFFGPDGKGTASTPIRVPGNLLTVSFYRDLSQMYQRAGDLFDEKANDDLAKADVGLSTLFSGRNFADEVLSGISPQMQFVIARQTFAEDKPIPSIKLPGFALVAELKDPKASRKEFRRNFINAIGFFNIVGAMNGQPQLEIDFESIEGGELVTTNMVPEVDQKPDTEARINYNFSPSIAFSDNLMIISTTSELAEAVATSKERLSIEPAEDSGDVQNTAMLLSVKELVRLVVDNRQHLISQNMLKEGHTQEEAETEIDSLVKFGRLLKNSRAALSTSETTLEFTLEVEINSEKSPRE
ncbi:hypothetical protein [Rubinisphaera sp.]|uniref:hypothetical protein n=1 Tax=Rubinisphaera sp. TaxID=2024857 RepID=UPI000C0F5289|nr:hypothetical protein [Rubinisphaera sp.]MBV10883.1 hypothetical protein [Rubinisphaera sp.]HCS54807.1 hypothetical protein [Planctomycetaceae bacterium]|tara:strand:+ start:12000 stop:13808 length:1809 start_codon:yes stop_codon:yes gene_type:complete